MSGAYYNEIDRNAAAWLRELIKRNLIAPGEVDERSITEVDAADLRPYTQCHFFAGIGVWSYALRRAGWPDDRPVWTASLPCQPFSVAGDQRGLADERHLAPVWLDLLAQRRPPIAFGEQVSAAIRMGWLDSLFLQMESQGYACGAVVFPAASVGAPHIRERLYWVVDAELAGNRGSRCNDCRARSERRESVGVGGATRGLADDDDDAGRSVERGPRLSTHSDTPRGNDADRCGESGFVGDACCNGSAAGLSRPQPGDEGVAGVTDDASHQRATAGFWANAVWLPCRDGKARPVEPGTSPLVDGTPARVVRLRGYGNAIVADQAQAFIEAVMP